ncbi:MAG: type II toxin-antitoxin system RelE/ParE family toxin [Bacteroidota bacterium]|nr:type II toxin-antitoxin system RelE/ParE family toxin [Bacteroidota bacterium]MDX5431874.1 type II toxin-antitoxin system RelE/ParE family toxin [Bacteroidota bacterium]MDX5470588.1 type II toxin-antitoxin system RelE/ParE family toxin [Bacteroidota bacterium]
MAQIRWTDFAIGELNQIGEFISKDSKRYAELTVSELFEATEILEKHPRTGAVVPMFQNDAIRQLIKGNYRIIYLILDEDSIDILTVHNGSRLISNIMADLP